MLNNFAVLEDEVEIIHDLSAHRERHRRAQSAIYPISIWHAENLFSRNIREEAVALLAKTGTAFPDMVFDHADHQIGAGSFIVDAVKAGFVEKLFVLL